MAEEAPRTNFMEDIARKYQYVLDKSSPHVLYRWILFVLCLSIYLVRVYYRDGFFIVTYGLGIYLLNQFIGFLSPQFDPEESDLDGGLPTKESDEYRPFARRLPEFKFWHSSVRSVIISFFMTFFEVFDVPVFWPILLLYFIVLFFITMKRQIKHMVKYRYIPFSWGKKKYEGKAPAKDSK
mmetsp:Transcript_10143/g.10981  ORF Transcript_10143/g.10981 Transcript_10143/m.10981 type:complete len:181 (+) Transcript_10143:119-661(+)